MTIQEMKVEDILKKESFRRALPSAEAPDSVRGNSDYDSNAARQKIEYCYPTQADFLREFDPASHRINSLKYYPNLLIDSPTQENGRYMAKVRSRVAVAWQKRIHTKRTIALTGYDPDISVSRSKTDKNSQEGLAKFKEGWMGKNMDTAVHLAISADLKVGDTALCGYKSNGKFGYRLFSYDKGDTLYPHFDPMTGELVLFARKFHSTIENEKGEPHDVCFVDVWDESNYIQYRSAMPDEKSSAEWIVSSDLKAHNFGFCPIAYHRYGEPCWAGSQSLIEQHELAMSQLSENNAQYALRILYALGAEFEMEGSRDGTPTQINSTDPNAKVGFLEPADSSASFELQIKSLEKEIMRCSFAVESPEIKSGSDISSLTVKALMADSYLKALEDAKEYQEFLDKVVRIFIEGYGTEVEMRPQFNDLHIQIRLQPWTFMSESEVVTTLVQLCSIGVLSKKSATEYAFETLGLGAVDEIERVLQEEHDELVGTEDNALANQTSNTVNNARKALAELNS